MGTRTRRQRQRSRQTHTRIAMKASVLEMRNALYAQLTQVSTLVDGFAAKRPSATDDWVRWLQATEALCQRYNLVESAELAAHRSLILHENSLSDASVNSKRKRIFSRALETIHPVQALCAERFRKLDEKVDTVRSLLRQILVPAKAAGCIRYDPAVDFGAYLESLLQQFRQHEQVSASINGAIALIGKQDVILILAEEIDFE